MKAITAFAMSIILLAASSVSAEITMRDVAYSHDGVELEGYLAVPEGEAKGAVLVVHEWWGLNDYAKMRADKLAELGYVAFAVDMYGKGKVTDDPGQAGQWAGAVRGDKALYRARALAGLEAMHATGRTEGLRVAAIGYCFGGTTAVEMAYAGADLAGVVSFHGSPTVPGEGDGIHAAITICHGDADTFVPDESLNAMTDALDAKGVDWQLIRYAGAKHSFTNPGSDAYGMDGVGYDARADKRSWSQMLAFFDEVLGSE